MNSTKSRKRHPLANYLIKPRLQLRLTMLFVVVSCLGSFLSLGAIFLLTRIKTDGMEGLRTAWFYLSAIYPGFYIAAAVAIVVGILVGLYASRKVALPIFKVEQWANGLKKGDLTHRLGMRESDYWEEMAEYCNDFLKDIRQELKALEKMEKDAPDSVKEGIKSFLSKYRY